MKSKLRDSNIELLRILVMLGIVFSHISTKIDFSYSVNIITFNKLWLQFLSMFGSIGNVCFILITGYFLINKTKFETKHIFKIWFQMFLYSFGITILFKLISIDEVSLISLIKSIMPISMESWWFASNYFVLYLLSPYINKLLLSFKKSEFQKFLLLILTLWGFLPIFIQTLYNANELTFFIMIYCVGAYLNIYKEDFKPKQNKNRYMQIAIISIILLYSTAIVMDVFGLKYSVFAIKYNHFWYMNHLPMILTCVFLFLGFKNLKIKNSRVINIIASTTFGVYLIHEHPFVKIQIKHFISNLNLINSSFLGILSILIGIGIFTICSLIDYLRIVLIEKRLLDKIYNYISKIVLKLLKKVKWKLKIKRT